MRRRHKRRRSSGRENRFPKIDYKHLIVSIHCNFQVFALLKKRIKSRHVDN